MAEPALDVLHTGVNPVAEGEGLFRTETGGRIEIKKIEKTRKEDQTANGKKYRYAVSFQSTYPLPSSHTASPVQHRENPQKKGHRQDEEAQEPQGNQTVRGSYR